MDTLIKMLEKHFRCKVKSLSATEDSRKVIVNGVEYPVSEFSTKIVTELYLELGITG